VQPKAIKNTTRRLPKLNLEKSILAYGISLNRMVNPVIFGSTTCTKETRTNKKGMYHINAVDEVTQFEMVGSVEKISERDLIPILAQMLDSFLFAIKGFHADNSSEYIDRHVVALLRKLLIQKDE
jgi:hypothetical protein